MRKILAIILSFTVFSCSGGTLSGFDSDGDFPKTAEEREIEKIGRITGDQGLVIAGGGNKSSSATDGINVNSYLWRATLDTVHKLPIISADPFGGTILTDWHTLESGSKTRFKLNIFIIGSELRSDAIKVSAFKQKKNTRGDWIDQTPSTQLAQEIENKILLKAREIKFNSKK